MHDTTQVEARRGRAAAARSRASRSARSRVASIASLLSRPRPSRVRVRVEHELEDAAVARADVEDRGSGSRSARAAPRCPGPGAARVRASAQVAVGELGVMPFVTHVSTYTRAGARAPDHRDPVAAHPVQHGEPAGQRARGPGVARRHACGSRVRCPARRRDRTPNLVATARATGEPVARLPGSCGHSAGRPGRLDRRSLVRRGEGRLRLGTRRARHEVAGGGRGRRRARARRVAAGGRRAGS